MKRAGIRIGVLMAVFIMAVIGFGYLTNKENVDMTVDIQTATLPCISFQSGEKTINILAGYVEEMDMAFMRDTITPISNYKVRMNILKFEAEVENFTYELFTLDGEKKLWGKEVKKIENEITLQFESDVSLSSERVLRITLHLKDNRNVYYYTRVVDSEDTNIGSCITFAENFFQKEREKNFAEEYEQYLESSVEADDSTFHITTIQSHVDNITWGELNPEVRGEVYWDIKELNTTYAAIQLSYRVSCKGEENAAETYNIKEFFRIRNNGTNMYLLDYYRVAEQLFDGTKNFLNEKGILLGIGSSDVEYLCNKDGTRVSFVKERELWSYNNKAQEISQVFSFAMTETTDIRYLWDKHNIEVIAVAENGSTTFSVSGYMNRGVHEGENGIAIYYFDSEKNAVEEKAFLASNQSQAFLNRDTERKVYYNNQSDLVYVLLNGTLYEVNAKEDKKTSLVEGLKKGEYITSENGQIFAYQSTEGIEVLNLEKGTNYQIKTQEGEKARVLGFVREDIIYGSMMKESEGVTISGEAVLPMYKVEICNGNQEVQKVYQKESIFITDIFIENDFITLNRVQRDGERYIHTTPDYITSNADKEGGNISLITYETELKKKQIQLLFANGIDDQSAKLLQPRQVIFKEMPSMKVEEAETESQYYVYAHGSLKGIYSKAAYAVRGARELSGVAVSSKQEYLWEKKDRGVGYTNEYILPFSVQEGESTLEACLNKIAEYEGASEKNLGKELSAMEILERYTKGEGLDLAGCTIEEILYLVGTGHPVIGMIGEEQAILITGYDKNTVTYINPQNGTQTTEATEAVEALVNQSGNTLIGYVKGAE